MAGKRLDPSSVDQQIFEELPDAEKLWHGTASRRQISLMLARIRAKRGYTQKTVGEITGWDKSFLSRLESAQEDDFPAIKTLARFAEACGMTIGLVVCDRESNAYNDVTVVDAVTLISPEASASGLVDSEKVLNFQYLRDRKIDLPLYQDSDD